MCSAGAKCMPAGMSTPEPRKCWRTAGELSRSASTRALTSPVWPPQAPQSRPAACGLLALRLPWPASSISGANPLTRPLATRMPLAMAAAAAGSLAAWVRQGRSAAAACGGRPASSQRPGAALEGRLSASSLTPYSRPRISTKLKAEAGALRNSAQRWRHCSALRRCVASTCPRPARSTPSLTQ